MADAHARFALGPAGVSVADIAGPGFRLFPEPAGVCKVQLYRGEDETALAVALGAAPPAARRQVHLPNSIDWAWIAPGEWLLIGPELALTPLAVRLETALKSTFALVTDLTHGRSSFILSGPAARERLAAVCPLDARDESFPLGSVARSLLGDTGLFLARLADADGAPVFRLTVDQTMAGYAARMIGLP